MASESSATAFDLMLTDWQEIQSAKLNRRKEMESAKLRHWEAVKDQMQEQQAILEREGNWPGTETDLLSIIDREHWETYHCKILAWLLNSTSPHGLGDAFLRKFVELSGVKVPDDLSKVYAVCEESTEAGKTRADIVIRGPNLLIVVEVKLNAKEQDDQCGRLYRNYKKKRSTARFVFLTLKSAKPKSGTPEELEQFRHLRLSAVHEALSTCMKDVSSPLPGMAAAATYAEALRKITS